MSDSRPKPTQGHPSYKNLFAYELESGTFDDPIQNVSVCFLTRGEGDTLMELVAPLGQILPLMAPSEGGRALSCLLPGCRMKAAVHHLSEQGSV